MIQDASGVVFRALDTETNQTVAVRRFFPFGANGGGLQEDEQIAYHIAVERLAAITHPALRAVIGGGCDPVDGMPYIATEWIEGPRLEAIVRRGPLDPVQAAELLSQALEVCQLLSEVLAEEAVWVETSLTSIVVGAEGTGRGITFWIAPLKWLGKNDGQRGLESIITLTEEIMGWRGKTIAEHEGRGLGGWLKWLRGTARTTTLHQAREMLAASIGVEPPLPVKRPVRQATPRPVVVARKKKPARWPIFIAAAAASAALTGGGFLLVKRSQTAKAGMPEAAVTETPSPTPVIEPEAVAIPPLPAAPAPSRSRERSVAQVNREAAELLASSQKLDRAKRRAARGDSGARQSVRGGGRGIATGEKELGSADGRQARTGPLFQQWHGSHALSGIFQDPCQGRAPRLHHAEGSNCRDQPGVAGRNSSARTSACAARSAPRTPSAGPRSRSRTWPRSTRSNEWPSHERWVQRCPGVRRRRPREHGKIRRARHVVGDRRQRAHPRQPHAGRDHPLPDRTAWFSAAASACVSSTRRVSPNRSKPCARSSASTARARPDLGGDAQIHRQRGRGFRRRETLVRAAARRSGRALRRRSREAAARRFPRGDGDPPLDRPAAPRAAQPPRRRHRPR